MPHSGVAVSGSLSVWGLHVPHLYLWVFSDILPPFKDMQLS